MSLGSEAIATAKAIWPTQVVALRYSGNVPELAGSVAEAFCAGIERARVSTDEGLMNGADGAVRYVATDEPSGWANGINGQVVEMRFTGASAWIRLRVRGRMEQVGAVRLNVAAEYEAT